MKTLKKFETYTIDRCYSEKHLGFFSEFFVCIPLQEWGFKIENTWAWNFLIRNIAVSWVLLKRVRRKMTRLTDTNEEYVWNFFQNFPSTPLSRNEIWSWKNMIWTMVIYNLIFQFHRIGRWLVQQVLFDRLSEIFLRTSRSHFLQKTN